MKAVVLSSGGVDSSVMMLLLKNQNIDILPLHINYGQLAEDHEWEACGRVCEFLGLHPVKIDFPGFKFIPSGLTNPELDIEKFAFLPTRNLLFIVLGAAYGYGKSADTVAIGILANPIFPDQTIEFLKTAESCVSKSLGKSLKLLAPLTSLDKRDTLRLARKYGLPLELTYYCHSGQSVPCGQCISCKERIAAEESLSQSTATDKESIVAE